MAKSTLIFAAAALLVTGASAALDPIVIKGSKFFYKTNGTQFFIKGVAYQQGQGAKGAVASSDYVDPLGDPTACARDVPYLKSLGANTIRTYAIDPTKDHTKCMQLLDDAGIYVISDLGQPKLSIDRTSPQWNTELYDRYTSVIDSLAPYTNVIGFFAGNEVPNNLSYTGSSAFVKAAVRDTKSYIKAKNYRAMGVGYAADDDQTVRAQVASYFNCGDAGSQIDFWGYNIYEWCGDSSFETSGYAERVKEFATYSVPSFFAEYGCNTGGGGNRKFTEVAALYGDQMTPTFSGGIVFEYFQGDNDYGLVTQINPSSVSTLGGFQPFSTQLNAVQPKATEAASYNPTNTALACPPVASNWDASSTLPPTPDKGVCACMMSTLSCAAKSSVSTEAIGALFGQVCGGANGKAVCANIGRNTTTGTYGAYSMCNSTEQLSWAFNSYYGSLKSENKATGCDFAGNATLVKPATVNSCSAVLSSATNALPGATGGAGAGGAGAASSTTKKSDGGDIVGASLGGGKYFAVAGFTLLAAMSGMGMILL